MIAHEKDGIWSGNFDVDKQRPHGTTMTHDHVPSLSERKRHGRKILLHALLAALLYFNVSYLVRESGPATWNRNWNWNWNWSTRSKEVVESGTSKKFVWSDVKASTNLEYVPCYSDVEPSFQCAKLILPLDHLNDSDTRTVSLAVVRYPAPVPVTSKRYGGAFFTNPGGPGGSGVGLLTRPGLAKLLQSSVSEMKDGLVYDIISWDPRGVADSSPGFDAVPGFWRREWSYERNEHREDFRYKNVLQEFTARMSGFATLLRRGFDDEKNVGVYVGTTSVVRDMVALIEAHGVWREKEAKTVLASTGASKIEREEALERTKAKGENEMLNFWGFSYGSLVAQYFASMFPFRYDRLIIDGVVDVRSWIETSSVGGIEDVDLVSGQFAEECYLAGPMLCQMYNSSGPDAILSTMNIFLESLERDGPLVQIVDDAPLVVTIADFAYAIVNAFYKGQQRFKNVDTYLYAGINRDFSKLKFMHEPITCSSGPAPLPEGDAYAAISCIDRPPGNWKSYMKASHLDAEVSRNYNASALLGGTGFGMTSLIACTALDDLLLPEHLRFTGPFGFNATQFNTRKPKPILFASTSRDPITPISGARTARANFQGAQAGLVVNDASGHCSNAWKSECVERHIRMYVKTGEVDAEKELWCEKEGHADWKRDEVGVQEWERERVRRRSPLEIW